MYLRRVEVHGFKSFADRQRFEFVPGMTAVVGPNGSGKSNVSDAIRWALGEQSARAIRARKTEDVIFAGSDRRRAVGLAEVTLVLDNTERWMPVDFAEVAVTRRAYRSGESEYLINGAKVRLLDVQELFHKAQVGQNSYAMMSQGLVDEVLALRPHERRELIEEAADVHRHRIELTRAERRLTETRDNLGHVRILIREVEPRLRQLERQSARAERYRTLAVELMGVLQVYYEHELRSADDALTAARARHDQHARAFAAVEQELASLAGRLEMADRTVAERRARLEQLQAEERARTEELLRLQQQVALAEQRAELLAERQAEVEAEIAATPDVADDAETPAARLAVLDAQAAEAAATFERAQAALRDADGAASELLRALATAEARRARLEDALRDVEARIAEQRAAQEARARERGAAAERRLALHDQLRAYGVRARELHGEQRALVQAAQDALRRRELAERDLEERQRAQADARDAALAAAAAVAQLEERQRLLQELLEQAADASAAGQALLEGARQQDALGQPLVAGVVGALSRLLRVPEGLERAIEAALAEQLSAIVVEREPDGIAALAYLREQHAGAVTVLPLDAVRHQYPVNVFNERGVVGVAARLVRCDARYRPLVDTLLGRTIVVDDLEVAQRMRERGLGALVTRDGVLLRQNGSLYGGGVGGGGEQLRTQAAIEALPAEIAAARGLAEDAAQRGGYAERATNDARSAVAAARRGLDEAEAARRAHASAQSAARRELVSIAAALRMAQTTIAAGDGSGAPAAAFAALEERRAAAQAELAALGSELPTLRDRGGAVTLERDAAAAAVASASATLAAAEGARGAARQQLAERTELRRQLQERLAQRRALLTDVRREREDLVLSLQGLRAQLAHARSALAETAALVAPAHAAQADALGEQRELSTARGDLQARRYGTERELLHAEGELRRAAEHAQALTQQVADEGLVLTADGSVQPAAPSVGAASEAAPETATPAVVPTGGGADVEPAALRRRITELRTDIRALGPVNLEALDDLSEERERHGFLTQQVADLEAAETELRTAIRDLERLIRERFDTSFVEVNAHFGEYFRRFFGGGNAELRVVEPDEAGGEVGVEIHAQLPGKRIASLAVLSGGERALTSVALLFALLAVNPAPVCVLDEVDAALDEANVGRFVDTLQELTARSQFIVITHNRRTVEAADTIYGVSMGEDSASQLLSLRVGDAVAAAS